MLHERRSPSRDMVVDFSVPATCNFSTLQRKGSDPLRWKEMKFNDERKLMKITHRKMSLHRKITEHLLGVLDELGR